MCRRNAGNVVFFASVLFFLNLHTCACAVDQKQPDIPPGMEVITVGPTQILIPVGTKVTRKDALLVLEPPDQYMARKILSMEERMADMARQIERLQQEINALKETVAQGRIKQDPVGTAQP